MESRVQMVGSKLNCTQEKLGETGTPMFFFRCQFFARALLSENLEQATIGDKIVETLS